MNTKVILGVVVAAIVIIVGFYLLHPANAPAPASATNLNLNASTTPPTSVQKNGTGKQPTFTFGKPSAQGSSGAMLDLAYYMSTSTYPVITGTATAAKVGILISDSSGKGIVATNDIPVVKGHWSYTCSVALKPGSYMVVLLLGNAPVEASQLLVNK